LSSNGIVLPSYIANSITLNSLVRYYPRTGINFARQLFFPGFNYESVANTIYSATDSERRYHTIFAIHLRTSLVALILSIPVYEAVNTGWQLYASMILCKGEYVCTRTRVARIHTHRLVQKHMYIGMYTDVQTCVGMRYTKALKCFVPYSHLEYLCPL